MDNRERNNDHLGVNKFGKNIRKSPLHQPSFANTARQQSQPQVYNINKNDFRQIVQQLTGSPARDPLPRPPPVNSPKPQSQRLQKIRPPPLTPISRPPLPIHPPAQAPGPPMAAPPVPYGNNAFVRPPPQSNQPSPTLMPPQLAQGSNVGESPVSLYMRYLQSSIMDSGPRQPYPQPLPQPQPQVNAASPGLLPNPPVYPLTSPQVSGPQPLLPSPTSQFLLPSPNIFMNLLSPRSPYPLLSPGYQFPPPLSPNFGFPPPLSPNFGFPPPLSPNFGFPPMGQSGVLGPGPQPPLSPGISFPLSPAGFFPVLSPRWRDQKS